MNKQVDYKSQDFYKILDTINSVSDFNLASTSGRIIESKYDTGLYGDKIIWLLNQKAITTKEYFNIYNKLKQVFPKYINNRVIRISNNANNNNLFSIRILLASLDDNIRQR